MQLHSSSLRALSPSPLRLVVLAFFLTPILSFAQATPSRSISPDQPVTFSAPGAYPVTLQVCKPSYPSGPLICSTITHLVTVLSPLPSISSAVATSTQFSSDSSTQLQLTGVTGQPPITLGWNITDNATQEVVMASSLPIATLYGLPPGAYTATAIARNSSGSQSKSIQLLITPPLNLNFYTLPRPCRALDTRPELVATSLIVNLTSCDVPPGARAASITITALTPTAPGYMSIYQSDALQPIPLPSVINYTAGTPAISSNAIIPLSLGSPSFRLVATPSTSAAIIDVSGYFAP